MSTDSGGKDVRMTDIDTDRMRADLEARRMTNVCKLRNGQGEECGISPTTHVWRWSNSPPVDEYVCDYHARMFEGDECDPLPGCERRTKGSPGHRERDDDPRPVWQTRRQDA